MSKNIAFFFPFNSRYIRLNSKNHFPNEFFYSYFNLKKKNFKIDIFDSRENPKKLELKLLSIFEKLRNRIINLSYSKSIIYNYKKKLQHIDVLFSFHDSFSLSVARYRQHLKNNNIKLCCGFMGLSDLETRANKIFRKNVKKNIIDLLKNIDHIFFFSNEDRYESCKKYLIDIKKTSIIPFGVDTNFWQPNNNDRDDFLLSIGSDFNRDYETLVDSIPLNYKCSIISRMQVNIKKNYNIQILRGSYGDNLIDDNEIKNFYQKCKYLIITTHDVFQPSGQSVILQAMSCGAVVIFTKTKSKWYMPHLKHKENCIMVDCYQKNQIKKYISLLDNDSDLRKKISKNAINTIEQHYKSSNMNQYIEKLISIN